MAHAKRRYAQDKMGATRRQLGMQHDCQPLANGNILLFANGCNIPVNPFSRVIEFNPKRRKAVWEYCGRPSYTFFSPHISGAQRLVSGDTLICEGQRDVSSR
jgi:hypothetical protein